MFSSTIMLGYSYVSSTVMLGYSYVQFYCNAGYSYVQFYCNAWIFICSVLLNGLNVIYCTYMCCNDAQICTAILSS